MKGAGPYLAIIGVFVFALLASAGIAGYLYFTSFRIAPSPLIKSENLLKQYLGVSGNFSKPLRGIRLLTIVSQKFFKQTDDCISAKRSVDPVFCFDESAKNGQMIINVYPNTNEIKQTDPLITGRLLNLNLLSFLEANFNINSDKKNLYLDNGEDNFIFKW